MWWWWWCMPSLPPSLPPSSLALSPGLSPGLIPLRLPLAIGRTRGETQEVKGKGGKPTRIRKQKPAADHEWETEPKTAKSRRRREGGKQEKPEITCYPLERRCRALVLIACLAVPCRARLPAQHARQSLPVDQGEPCVLSVACANCFIPTSPPDHEEGTRRKPSQTSPTRTKIKQCLPSSASL